MFTGERERDSSSQDYTSEFIRAMEDVEPFSARVPSSDNQPAVVGSEERLPGSEVSFTAVLGEKIKGFRGDISTMAHLPDDRIMVGGMFGEIRFLDKKNEDWEFGERIRGFEEDIWTIAPLSDNQFAVGGWYGELRILTSVQLTPQNLKQAILEGKVV